MPTDRRSLPVMPEHEGLTASRQRLVLDIWNCSAICLRAAPLMWVRSTFAGVAEIAQRVGHGSASAFSVAFTRHVGLPPTFYAREQTAAAHADGQSNVLLPKTDEEFASQPPAI